MSNIKTAMATTSSVPPMIPMTGHGEGGAVLSGSVVARASSSVFPVWVASLTCVVVIVSVTTASVDEGVGAVVVVVSFVVFAGVIGRAVGECVVVGFGARWP